MYPGGIDYFCAYIDGVNFGLWLALRFAGLFCGLDGKFVGFRVLFMVS